MATRHFQWTDIRHMPQLLWSNSARRHDPAAGSADLTLTSRWTKGPAAHSAGPHIFSLTQFTPNKARDVPAIWLAGSRLADQLARIDGAAGVVTYIRPARCQLGALSVWIDDRGLAEFMSLPKHIDIMTKYRTRGRPIRSAKWCSDHLDVHFAVTHGLYLLDTHDTQRVIIPKA
ncbi:hypothetical protein [Nocardia colli]|uniref:hypothetical protein n=1 Tax=Nocardia colli TaxID=2545717 RepID=UPI0035E21F43